MYNLIGIRVRIGVVTVLYVQNKTPSGKNERNLGKCFGGSVNVSDGLN